MDHYQFLRVVAVLLELCILSIMMFCILWGLKLLLADLGINKKYDKAIIMALGVVLFVCVVFFTMHLSAFYPVYKAP